MGAAGRAKLERIAALVAAADAPGWPRPLSWRGVVGGALALDPDHDRVGLDPGFGARGGLVLALLERGLHAAGAAGDDLAGRDVRGALEREPGGLVREVGDRDRDQAGTELPGRNGDARVGDRG